MNFKIKFMISIFFIIFILLILFMSVQGKWFESYKNELPYYNKIGRHNTLQESWGIGFYVTSSDGRNFSGGVLYHLIEHGKSLNRMIALTDIKNNIFYYSIDTFESEQFIIKEDVLDLTIENDNKIDRFYTLKPNNYKFIAGFIDRGIQISFDCIFKNNKESAFETSLDFIGLDFKKTYYQDITNINVTGYLVIDDETIEISGKGYISREWGNKLVASWNWFGIQLENNWEIIAFKTYENNQVLTKAWIITPDGWWIVNQDLVINEKEYSSYGFVKKWILTSIKDAFNLTIETTVDNQIIGSFFEGSCTVKGTWYSEPIKGIAFSEQTKKLNNKFY